MFQITGRTAAIVLWVQPCRAHCETCGTAFAVHEDSIALLAKAIGEPVKGQLVCLCEGEFLE
jgi:hypothetical protein